MPAFPAPDNRGLPPGLSKREAFASMAMKGLLSCYQAQQDTQSDPRYNGENFKEVVALNSVEFADALLAELSKPQP